MRDAVPVALIIVSLVAISVILASTASTFALARPQVKGLDVDMASVIRADYSADPSGTRLAPLSGEITDAAHGDKGRLREKNPRIKSAPVFHRGPSNERTPDKEKRKQQKPDNEKTKQ